MEKEFIPYEQALALKELGFDEPCFAGFGKKGEFKYKVHLALDLEMVEEVTENFNKYVGTYYQVSAPLYQQAFRWFREKYVLLGFIEPANGYEDKSLFAFYICDDEQNIINDEHSYSKDSSLHFKTYEEAELAGLIKLIKIVKTNDTST